VEKYCGDGQHTDEYMGVRYEYWIPKATSAYSEYIILTDFLQQQWWHARASMLLSTYTQWRTQEFFSEGRGFNPGIISGSTNSVEDRGQGERASGGGSPLVRGSGGSYNLIQEISFHTVKFS
jgi:hypothetical protein